MKVLFVNPVGIIGGAERALLTILAALQTAQPNIQLHLIVGTDGALVKSAVELGVQVTILPLPQEILQLGDSALKGNSRLMTILILLWRSLATLPAINKYLAEFRQTIQEINPNLIHSNGIKTHLLTGLLDLNSVPIIWHIHDFYSTRPLIAKVLRCLSNRATAGIAITEAVAIDTRKTLPNLPIKVIYNSVDVNYFSPGTTNLPVDTIKIGLVATFARWKGHDVFLKAAANLLREHPNLNVHFYIVGGAIYETKGSQFSEQELRELSSTLQIANKVEFLGFQQNIADIYRWLDIVIHASTQPEPFGLAIVEAMACKKPVIVSQAGGAAELFTHNYDAVGVPPGDSAALASAILHLIDNPKLCKSLSENARSTVIKRFNHQHLATQILTLYNSIDVLEKSLDFLQKSGTGNRKQGTVDKN
jgi:glycosyltransferase involved in cell wall biosynthesis